MQPFFWCGILDLLFFYSVLPSFVLFLFGWGEGLWLRSQSTIGTNTGPLFLLWGGLLVRQHLGWKLVFFIQLKILFKRVCVSWQWYFIFAVLFLLSLNRHGHKPQVDSSGSLFTIYLHSSDFFVIYHLQEALFSNHSFSTRRQVGPADELTVWNISKANDSSLLNCHLKNFLLITTRWHCGDSGLLTPSNTQQVMSHIRQVQNQTNYILFNGIETYHRRLNKRLINTADLFSSIAGTESI